MDKEIREKFKRVRIVFMDVDGVLTDGSVVFTAQGSLRNWHVRDRLGIKILTGLKDPDIKVVWITGRPTPGIKERAQELGVDEVFWDVKDKVTVMDNVLSKYNVDASQAMYIGDDLVDIGCMSRAGVRCCPADAVKEVKEEADFISSCPGGKGVVREIIEELLRSRGLWNEIVEQYKKGETSSS